MTSAFVLELADCEIAIAKRNNMTFSNSEIANSEIRIMMHSDSDESSTLWKNVIDFALLGYT